MKPWTRNQMLLLAAAFAATFLAVCFIGMRGADGALPGSSAVADLAPSALPRGTGVSGHAAASPAPPITSERAEDSAAQDESAGPMRSLHELALNPTSDTVPELVSIAQQDVEIRNRVLALDGLRRAALAGIPDPRIDAELQAAANSGDATLAGVARSALTQIERNRPAK